MNNLSDETPLPSTPTETCNVHLMHASLHGLNFQLAAEPDGEVWVEVARGNGELIAYEPLPPHFAGLCAFADQWIANRLGEISPVHRCASCGLPVEVVDRNLVLHHHPNHAIDYHLWVEFAVETQDEVDDDHGRYVQLALCVTCRNDLSRRHPWLGRLLSPPQNRRRIR